MLHTGNPQSALACPLREVCTWMMQLQRHVMSSGCTERSSVVVSLHSCCRREGSRRRPCGASWASRCVMLQHALWSSLMCSAPVSASTPLQGPHATEVAGTCHATEDY